MNQQSVAIVVAGALIAAAICLSRAPKNTFPVRPDLNRA